MTDRINSPEKPESYGQVSVFQSPSHRDVLLADIAVNGPYGHLTWWAIPHETHLYNAAIRDYQRGTLYITNYAGFLENNRPTF
jgi:hypothetical protein